jgi:hypothetical protein
MLDALKKGKKNVPGMASVSEMLLNVGTGNDRCLCQHHCCRNYKLTIMKHVFSGIRKINWLEGDSVADVIRKLKITRRLGERGDPYEKCCVDYLLLHGVSQQEVEDIK